MLSYRSNQIQNAKYNSECITLGVLLRDFDFMSNWMLFTSARRIHNFRNRTCSNQSNTCTTVWTVQKHKMTYFISFNMTLFSSGLKNKIIWDWRKQKNKRKYFWFNRRSITLIHTTKFINKKIAWYKWEWLYGIVCECRWKWFKIDIMGGCAAH